MTLKHEKQRGGDVRCSSHHVFWKEDGGLATQPAQFRRPKVNRRAIRWILPLTLFLLGLWVGTGFNLPAQFTGHLASLATARPAPDVYHPHISAAWYEADTRAVGAEALRWPISIPSLLREAASIWQARAELLQDGGAVAARGYTIYDWGTTSQIHFLTAALHNRLRAASGTWNEALAEQALSHYQGYPMSLHPSQGAVNPDDVRRILDGLPLPDEVFKGYRVFLLPYQLIDTAGLGMLNLAVLGAAAGPEHNSYTRTAYTLLHELGHHIHFRYMGRTWPKPSGVWNEYVEMRGIAAWSPSGPVGSDAWGLSPEETFAEDFRVLFGPPEANRVPHGTEYGDPRDDPETAAKLYEFIARLVNAEPGDPHDFDRRRTD